MSRQFNYKFTYIGEACYTAATYEEALERLEDDCGNVTVIDCDTEEFDPAVDDYMDGN